MASVVGLLLDKEDIRSSAEARRIFSNLPKLECVWTGVSLRDTFKVDHVIPFALWHNNDAWNLLQASRSANSKKSNKLPSHEILKHRKDSIVGYWESAIEEVKFFRQAETLLVIPIENWQNSLFGHLCSAFEMTALQRGVGRQPQQCDLAQ